MYIFENPIIIFSIFFFVVLSLYLLKDAKVSLVPGEDFGAPNCIRLSYAASEIELIEACKRLKESLSKLTSNGG